MSFFSFFFFGYIHFEYPSPNFFPFFFFASVWWRGIGYWVFFTGFLIGLQVAAPVLIFFSSNSMPSGISYRSVTRSARIGNHAINITEIDGIMGFFFVIKKNAIGRGSSFFFA